MRALRTVLLLTLILLGTSPILGNGAAKRVIGESGESYMIRSEKEVWRAVGPALAVRFHTTGASRSSAAAEASDLLDYFAAHADSAQLDYLLIGAYRPIWHLGSFGIYRAWNFRYERADDGWTASDYW
jgi:hypothetical protein